MILLSIFSQLAQWLSLKEQNKVYSDVKRVRNGDLVNGTWRK